MATSSPGWNQSASRDRPRTAVSPIGWIGVTGSSSSLAPVTMLAGSILRRRRLSVVAFGVLFGLAGGIGAACLAGAERTSTLFHRHLVASEAPDIEIDPGGVTPAVDHAMRSMAGVRSAQYWVNFSAYLLTPKGGIDNRFAQAITFTTNGRYLETDRIGVARGRRLDPRRRDEVMINESYAEASGLNVGSRVRVGVFAADKDFLPVRETADRTYEVTVVGIMVINEEITAEAIDTIPRLFVSPAVAPKPVDRAAYYGYSWYGLGLTNGQAGAPAVERRWKALADAHNQALAKASPAGSEVTGQWLTYVHRTADLERKAARSVRPLTTTLAGFGFLVLIAAVTLAAQSLGRSVRNGRSEQRVAQVLGLTPRQAVVVAMVAPAAALVVAAVVALVVAASASLLFPMGPFVALEPSPGLSINPTVFVGVVAALVLFPLATVLFIASREARSNAGRATATAPTPGRLATLASGSGRWLPLAAAVRFTTMPGRGRSFVPTRSMFVSVVVTVAALVAVLQFGGNLAALDRDPHRFGWPSGGVIASDGGYSPFDAPKLEDWLRGHPKKVSRWRLVSAGQATVSGRSVPAAIFGPGFDGFSPTLISGRAPARAGEVVLGASTLKQIRARIGDEIRVGTGTRRRTERITGTAVFPVLGPVLAVRTGLDIGAWFHGADYHQLSNIAAIIDDFGGADQAYYSLALVDLAPGETVAALQRTLTTAQLTPGSTVDTFGVIRPSEVRTATAARGGVQILLGAVLALAAGLSLLFTLAVLVRRRRSELAVYRILGFTPGQVRSTLVWQGLLVAGTAVVVGVPIGIAVGRTFWRSFAAHLGVVPDPLVPVGAMAIAAVATLLIGFLSALGPAIAAARVPPAVGVRAE